MTVRLVAVLLADRAGPAMQGQISRPVGRRRRRLRRAAQNVGDHESAPRQVMVMVMMGHDAAGHVVDGHGRTDLPTTFGGHFAQFEFDSNAIFRQMRDCLLSENAVFSIVFSLQSLLNSVENHSERNFL